MSYHAIENLVEDAIHLIERTKLPISEQRNIIYNLYQFQNRFDTGYTVLRCFPFLEKIGFIKKLPINAHPDLNNNPKRLEAFKDLDWIPSDINDDDSIPVYHQDGFIFPQYGSAIWKRLNQSGEWKETTVAPTEIPVLELVSKMIELAKDHGEMSLMHNFYLAFIHAYLEFDINHDDGIPQHFEDWVTDPQMLKLHELLVQNELLKVKKSDTDFEIPRLSEEISYHQDPDKKAKIKYLMDPKKSIETILAAYLKDKKAAEELPHKIELIAEILKKEMNNQEWIFISEEVDAAKNSTEWIWYKEISSSEQTGRILTAVTLDIELSSIFAKQYVQHGLLLAWQEKSISNNIADAHFQIYTFELMDLEEIEKKLNDLGLWILPLKSTDKKLIESTELFLKYLGKIGSTYLDKINENFPKSFFSKPYKSYIKIFESTSPINAFLLIPNLYSISLLFIYYLVHQGKLEEALSINEIQEGRLTDRFRENIIWYKKDYLPFINAIKAGKKPALPEMFRMN